jgi:hypothetical protein
MPIDLYFFVLHLKKSGSRKVTKIGKVEKVSSPIATVDIWMEWKKVTQ